MASSLLDVCRFTPTLGGTTNWTFASAVLGYQSPTAAGVVNGAQYSYRAESADLTQWEIGVGTYNTSSGVLSRTTVLFNSLGTTALINFSATPQVALVALAEDLNIRAFGGIDLSTTISIIAATTLTTSAFGKFHLLSGTAAYTVTLPTPVGNTGALIAISVDTPTNATKLYTISSPSGNVGRNTSLIMWAFEQIVIRSDGTNWVIVSAKQVPFVGTINRSTNQTSSTSTAVQFTTPSSDPTGLNLAYDSTGLQFKAPRAGSYQFNAYIYQTQSGGSYNQIIVGSASSAFSYTGSLGAGTVYGTAKALCTAGQAVPVYARCDGSSPTIAAATVGAFLDYQEIVPSW